MSTMPQKILTVIVGAGAPYDCVERDIADFDENYRPPLVNELFAFRGSFNAILKKYPKAEALSEELRTKLKAGNVSIETLLQQYQSEKDPILRRQFLEIPLYLQELLGEVSSHFVRSGATKFETLVSILLRSDFEKIIFITTNYDLFIENAFRKIASYQFVDIPSYIPKDKKWALIKLHGSVNWGFKMLNPINERSSSIAVLDSISDEIKFGNGIQVLGGYQDQHRFANGLFFYPAIAVPVAGKNDFVCPIEHLEALGLFLMQCTNFLVIGFSALDQHILDQLKLVHDVERLKIVNGKKESAQETLKRINVHNQKFWRQQPSTLADSLYAGGFREFITGGDLEKFLSS